MRFQVTDHEVPGAGMYPLPDSVQIKNPAKIHASFKSSVQQTSDIALNKANPGVGEYDTEQYKSIANKEF